MRKMKWMILLLLAVCFGGLCRAESLTFVSRELFRIPFGKSPDGLGARIDVGSFIFPRDFTMDASGHFYIYDSNNHRIVRFSSAGKYEIDFRYLPTATHVFAHADSHENLWLLISDPAQGMYYGIYDPRGKLLKSGIFSQFNQYHLHLDDHYTLHVMLSSEKNPAALETFILDEKSLLLKRENIARPSETHHEVRKSEHVYFVDQVPDGSKDDSHHVNRVTDESHHDVADLKGTVVYVTDRGEIYTRVGDCEIHVYDITGSLIGKVLMSGLSSACRSIRFDSYGNMYELDGIPGADRQYTADMPGMRLVEWERQ
jgi:hypothetical protein